MLQTRLIDEAVRRPALAPAVRAAGPERQLEGYLAGWAAADLGRILAAVAPDYRLEDPLVGAFDRDGLGAYLGLLRDPARPSAQGVVRGRSGGAGARAAGAVLAHAAGDRARRDLHDRARCHRRSA